MEKEMMTANTNARPMWLRAKDWGIADMDAPLFVLVVKTDDPAETACCETCGLFFREFAEVHLSNDDQMLFCLGCLAEYGELVPNPPE
jgi:hypothetical protein